MNCSTTTFSVGHRSTLVIPEETSPILSMGRDDGSSLDSGSNEPALISKKSPTNVSSGLAESHLTPLKKESSTLENLGLVTTTNNWTRAAMACGVIRMWRSLSDHQLSL